MVLKQSSGLFKGAPENGIAPQDKICQSTTALIW
ncbi:hypothetical protein SMU74_09707 [Streptococcus mutans M2A]|nr:hypothetical protein SMU74_09707 [Streptococcus mutans M2A]